MEHPEDVVIGNDQQLRRIGERSILGIPPRLGMPVRAQQRQVFDAGKEGAGNGTSLWLGIEQAVIVKQCGQVSSPSEWKC